MPLSSTAATRGAVPRQATQAGTFAFVQLDTSTTLDRGFSSAVCDGWTIAETMQLQGSVLDNKNGRRVRLTNGTSPTCCWRIKSTYFSGQHCIATDNVAAALRVHSQLKNLRFWDQPHFFHKTTMDKRRKRPTWQMHADKLTHRIAVAPSPLLFSDRPQLTHNALYDTGRAKGASLVLHDRPSDT